MCDKGSPLGTFFEAWEFYQYPTLTAIIVGMVLGLLGVYVVLRRLVFLSAAISQAASLGVALWFYLQLTVGLTGFLASPTLGAMILTLLVALLVATGRDRPRVPRDSLLGFAYLVGLAGTLVLATRIVTKIQDIKTMLLGSAVAVVPEDFWLIVGVGATVLALHLWWWRGFAAVSFDRDGARVRGLPVIFLEVVLLGTLAVTVSVATRVIGVLPTFAFSVLPAMAAIRISPNVPTALLLAALIGGACGFGGYLLAFVAGFPVGASQTLVAAGLVVLAEGGWRLFKVIRT